MGKVYSDLEAQMRDNPMLERVIGGLVWLVIFTIIYLIARCCGWNPDEIKR